MQERALTLNQLHIYYMRQRETDCLHYMIMQDYDVGLHTRRHSTYAALTFSVIAMNLTPSMYTHTVTL